jgi:hypothetical protein
MGFGHGKIISGIAQDSLDQGGPGSGHSYDKYGISISLGRVCFGHGIIPAWRIKSQDIFEQTFNTLA